MEYISYQMTIKDLISNIKAEAINLHPAYQRNFIWTTTDQRLLVDSIHKEYPLPNFFVYRRKSNLLEMVDGQQRAMTIYRYYKGDFKDNLRHIFTETDQDQFLNYKLNIIEITKIFQDKGESLEEFYWMVNKRGVHLNPAEVNKARYHDSDFLVLVNKVMAIPALDDLDIFSTKVKTRMNDRSLVEELVAYLFDDITDKRNAVEQLFRQDISKDEQEKVYIRANYILQRIDMLNGEYPISETRYKQRNDFYTLWCFVDKTIENSDEILKAQYEILQFISKKGYITPSNDDCQSFKEYALNCVSQSNSKKAREARLGFFLDILCNKNITKNKTLLNIEDYFCNMYGLEALPLIEVGGYQLMDITKLNS